MEGEVGRDGGFRRDVVCFGFAYDVEGRRSVNSTAMVDARGIARVGELAVG